VEKEDRTQKVVQDLWSLNANTIVDKYSTKDVCKNALLKLAMPDPLSFHPGPNLWVLGNDPRPKIKALQSLCGAWLWSIQMESAIHGDYPNLLNCTQNPRIFHGEEGQNPHGGSIPLVIEC